MCVEDLSYNTNVTMEMINAYPDKPWNWVELSRNKYKQYVQDYLFEEIVKVAWHPNRVKKLLEMGLTIDEICDLK